MSKTAVRKLPDMSDWTDQAIHEFWEIHDSADYWDQTKPVTVKTLRQGQRAVSVKLDEADIALLKAIARQLGLGHTTLIRVWIKEKLRKMQGAKAAK